MKNILTIFQKEMKRIFSDKRMLISLFLPGVLIFALYSILGTFMQENIMTSKTKNTVFEVVYTDNYSSDLSTKPILLTYLDTMMSDGNSINSTTIEYQQVDEYKEKLKNREFHLLITFSDNFEQDVYDSNKKLTNNISLFYNGETSASSDIYVLANTAISTAYVNYTQNMDGLNPLNPNLGKKDSIMMQVLSFIFPMITVSILFSTVISLCPESIAGEKERGTLASLLLTPIRRSEFAIGKIISLSTLCIASGITTFAGLILSLPKLMGNISLGLTGLEIFLLLLIIISALLLFVAMGIAISAFSNSIKEATSYLSPLMLLFMLLGIIPASIGNSLWESFIPVLNISASMHSLLMGSGNIVLIFSITIGINLIVTALIILLVTKLFEKERIILGQ